MLTLKFYKAAILCFVIIFISLTAITACSGEMITSQYDYSDINLEMYKTGVPEDIVFQAPQCGEFTVTDDNIDSTINNIYNILIQGTDDPYLIIKRLHDWVAVNITYDIEDLFSTRDRAQDQETVLNECSAVCEGFATVFKSFADLSGIENVKISGKAKGAGYDDSGILQDHAWNAVKIDNKWLLIDSTWDNGSLDLMSNEYITEYNTYYLFVDPEKLIYTHLPDSDQSEWQLLQHPISLEQFSNLPYLRIEFFEYGLSLTEPIYSDYYINGEGQISITVPENTVFKALLLDPQARQYLQDYTFTNQMDDITTFHFLPPDSGDYVLEIYTAVEENPLEASTVQYDFVASINIVQEAEFSNQPQGYPVQYPAFSGCSLESPLQVRTQQMVNFRIYAPHLQSIVVFPRNDGQAAIMSSDVSDLELVDGFFVLNDYLVKDSDYLVISTRMESGGFNNLVVYDLRQ